MTIVVHTYNVHIMCHRAKFHKNRLNFYIFQDGGHRHLGIFQNFNFLMATTVKRVELHHCDKFRRNRLNRDRDMLSFNIMLVWLENAYSRSFLGFFGAHSPKGCHSSS